MKQKLALHLGVIITLLIVSVLSIECNRTTLHPFPAPIDGCAYFTDNYELPQTQSAQLLSEYLSSEHMEYDLDGWFFFGSLVDSAYPDDLGTFFIAVQRIDRSIAGFRIPTVPAIVAFNNSKLGKYEFRGFMSIDTSSLVTVESNPWDVTLTSPFQEGPLIKMSLASGTMGMADAVYNLSVNLPDFENEWLKAEVQIRDRFGAVNQGDGTASFFAQFITDSQREQIMNSPDRKLSTYLTQTNDPMSCKGSYYYSLPLLDVEQFSIKLNDSLLSKGTDGLMWMDYVVQSYDNTAMEVFKDASWEFYAIQLPEIDAALMIIEIKSETGSLPIAKLFNTNSDKTLNFASKAIHSWAINEINIQPVPGTNWTSPSTGEEYAMQHRIQLMSDDYPVDIVIEMINKNQEVVIDLNIPGVPKTIKYEGMASVEGMLGNKAVTGQAFVEMQPVGALK